MPQRGDKCHLLPHHPGGGGWGELERHSAPDEAVSMPTELAPPRTRLRGAPGPMSLPTRRPEEQEAAGKGKLLLH